MGMGQGSISPSARHPISPSSHIPSSHQPITIKAHQPISLPTRQPINPSARQPINPSARQPISPSARQPINPSTHQSVIPSSQQPISPPPVHQPISPPAHQPISLPARSAHQPTSLPVQSVHQSISSSEARTAAALNAALMMSPGARRFMYMISYSVSFMSLTFTWAVSEIDGICQETHAAQMSTRSHLRKRASKLVCGHDSPARCGSRVARSSAARSGTRARVECASMGRVDAAEPRRGNTCTSW